MWQHKMFVHTELRTHEDVVHQKAGEVSVRHAEPQRSIYATLLEMLRLRPDNDEIRPMAIDAHEHVLELTVPDLMLQCRVTQL